MKRRIIVRPLGPIHASNFEIGIIRISYPHLRSWRPTKWRVGIGSPSSDTVSRGKLFPFELSLAEFVPFAFVPTFDSIDHVAFLMYRDVLNRAPAVPKDRSEE